MFDLDKVNKEKRNVIEKINKEERKRRKKIKKGRRKDDDSATDTGDNKFSRRARPIFRSRERNDDILSLNISRPLLPVIRRTDLFPRTPLDPVQDLGGHVGLRDCIGHVARESV